MVDRDEVMPASLRWRASRRKSPHVQSHAALPTIGTRAVAVWRMMSKSKRARRTPKLAHAEEWGKLRARPCIGSRGSPAWSGV